MADAPTVAMAADPISPAPSVPAAMVEAQTVAVAMDPVPAVAEPANDGQTVAVQMVASGAVAVAADDVPTARMSADPPPPTFTSRTSMTLMGMQVARFDLPSTTPEPNGASTAPANGVATTQAPPAEAAPAPTSTEKGRYRWSALARTVMVIGGLALVGVFAAGSSLLVSLVGPQLVLAKYYLVGGLLLAAGGVLSLPDKLRAALATLVGAVPLFVAAPVVGGLAGWRGLAAAMVFLLLPGSLLLRARGTGSKLASLLVVVCVGLAVAIYVVPDGGVVPLEVIIKQLRSGSLTYALGGLFFLAPLALVTATLTALGRESSTLGNLWASLVLSTAAGAIVLAGVSREDPSLIHLGVGLLAAGAATAVGVGQLLDVDA
jgi:hypothetical protein